MDRNIVYPASIPLDTDLLSTNRNMMLALGFLTQAALGTTTVVDGLACTPTAPASLTVNVGPGSILGLSTVDSTNTSGQSTNYLLEAAFEETDIAPVVLPYYNAANPTQPYTGPNNSGTAQNTQRIQRVQLQLKPGAPANAGSQQTPPADSGWVGLYVITVNYGQTQLTAANIAPVPTAPFISFKLAQLTPGVSRLAFIPVSQNWLVPPGVNLVRVRLWGGGGGGGGGGNSAGGGGAGGGYSEGYYSVTPGSGIAVTIGQGGNAGSAGATTGFGSLATATGGSAGASGTSSSTGAGGTSAGIGTGSGSNYWTVAGTQGQNGIIVGSGYMGGAAGTAFGGGVAWGPAGSSSITGNSGQVPGAGGSGGIVNGAGGVGAAGLAVLEW